MILRGIAHAERRFTNRPYTVAPCAIAIAIDFDFDFDSDSDFDSYGVATHLKPHEPRPAMVNGIASELLFPVFFQS
jgi:hypothetical protein